MHRDESVINYKDKRQMFKIDLYLANQFIYESFFSYSSLLDSAV